MFNETFLILSDEEKQTKLKTAIKAKAENSLTDGELRAIVLAVPSKRQYTIKVYYAPDEFKKTFFLSDCKATETILGSLVPGMPDATNVLFSSEHAAAFITKKSADAKELRRLHIYIPQARLQKGCADCEK